jgi:hypothetical protein
MSFAIAFVLATAVSADESPKTLGQQAAKRGQEFTPVAPAPVSEEDRQRAEELSKIAIERGQTALREWEEQQASTAGESTGHWAPIPKAKDATGQGPVAGRLIVALSSSMPMTMVHDYMVQLAGIPEAVVVLRGFIGGAHTIAPTGKWIEEARRVTPGCLRCEHYNVQTVVDPLIYRDLKIDQVPAVAWAPGVTDISHCDGKSLKGAHVIFGAESVEASVKALATAGSAIPGAVFTKVRSKGWESKRHTPAS